VDDHQFEDALVIFRRIQRSRPHPIVLYNLAWCLSRLNRSQEAIAAFDSYLELSRDDAPERITEARMELARLREEERVTNPAVEILPISQESESEHRSRRRVHRGWFWSLLGATVATGISMAVTGGLTLSINERWLEQGNLSDRDTARGLQDATDGLLIVLSIEALSALVINFFTDFHRSSEEQIDEN
jgi:tetratricopeptide (TPR) repeat protein